MMKNHSRRQLAMTAFVLFVLLVGVLNALFLLSRTQDIRQQASGSNQSRVKLGVGGFRPEFLDDQQIKNVVLKYGFTQVTSAPSHFAWNIIHTSPKGPYNFTNTDKLVEFTQQNNLQLHGTPLIWPHVTTPKWLSDQEKTITKEELKAIMKEHLQTVVNRYRGKVYSYDVVNEVIDENGKLRPSIFSNLLGEEYIDLAFKYVHEADPNAKLFYNDYFIESSHNGTNKKAIAAYNLVKRLKARGVPIDGVGFQSHVNKELSEYTKQELVEQIQLYKQLGVQVDISEIDVRTGTDKPTAEQLDKQADIFRKYAGACLASENCYRFTTWGVSDDYSWLRIHFHDKESPLLFDDEKLPKPAYLSVARILDMHQFIRDNDAVAKADKAAQRAKTRQVTTPIKQFNDEPTSSAPEKTLQ